jgi:hypothetical protein
MFLTRVRYGDYAPDTGAARVFTAFYILMGVFIVFSRLGSILDAIFDSCYYVFNLRVYKAIRWLKRWCRGTPPDAKKEQGEEQGEEGVVALQPTWRFYTEQIGTTLLVGIIFSLGAPEIAPRSRRSTLTPTRDGTLSPPARAQSSRRGYSYSCSRGSATPTRFGTAGSPLPRWATETSVW